MSTPDSTIPAGLRYSHEHEWVKEMAGNRVRLGITHFAQNALGDIVYLNLPAAGDQVATGQACGEVESTKSVSDIFAPVAGTVVAINNELTATPELVNTDPYGAGWLIELTLDDPAQLHTLLAADGYAALLKQE